MLKLGRAKRGIRALLVGLAGQHARQLQAVAEGQKLRVVESSTCLEAWKRLHECSFDVVVIDEAADNHGWRDLLAEVGAMGLRVPVILASANADERLWLDALTAGAYDVLDIPFDAPETGRILLMAAKQQPYRCGARRRSSRLGSAGGRVLVSPAAARLPA